MRTRLASLSLVFVLGACDGGRREDASEVELTTDEHEVRTGLESRERVLFDETFAMTITLDETTVVCSSADYSASLLKVGIPDLAKVTLFDHRNFGVDAPCMAAGECTEALNESTLLADGVGNEDIELRVLLKGLYDIDHDVETCSVSLQEEVFTTIRGVEFYHLRSGFISQRIYDDCLGL